MTANYTTFCQSYIVMKEGSDIVSEVLSQIDIDQPDFSKNLIIFPGKRPSYFLIHRIKKYKGTAYMPPVIYSIDEFIDYCYEDELGLLDTKIDALSCCKILKDLSYTYETNPSPIDLNAFIPLAIKLYSALEELLIEGISYNSLKHIDVDAKLTKDKIVWLSDIYKSFYEELKRQKYSTRSLRYQKVSEGEVKLQGFDKIIFAGFFALTNSEKIIFKKFSNDNRTIFIFQDESAKSYIYENKYTSPPIPIDKITLYECPDSHSQVFILAEILKKDYEARKEGETFVIIAPSPDIIMPLINCIDKDFDTYNISLGYPLIKTPLYSFIKSLFDVLTSMNNNKVYIPDYLNFVLHPYTKNILFNDNSEITRTTFHSIENELNKNRFKNYLTLHDIEDLKCLKEVGNDSLKKHINSIHTNTIKTFNDLKNIKDFAGKLKNLIDFIYKNSTAKRHILFLPYCEYMLNALTELEHSRLAEESLKNPQEYFEFFKRFISLYNVPFKGTPIKDIQVLGFLESRNLKFDNLYILDVNEGILPNTNREDTILPFDVRNKLSLPTYRDKDRLFDYYLKTALNSSKRAVLFYVEDNQRERSRFIEQIIWERQKKEKNTEKDFFTPISYSFTLKPYKPFAISKDNPTKEYLKTMTYSASALDTYYQCPLMFYYRYVLLPSEDEGLYEELEGKDVGIIIHEIFNKYFADKCASYREQRFNEILNKVFSQFFGAELRGEILIVKYQIQKRLVEIISKYLEITKSESIEILELEKTFATVINIDCIGHISLIGKVDRLEKRDNKEVFVVDYKTSSDSRQYKARWDSFDISNRSTWKKAINSIQMVFYIYLLDNDPNCIHKPTNASIMLVRERDVNKLELILFEDDISHYKPSIYQIINTLITEIVTLPTFAPTDDLNECDRCNYKDICWR